MYMYTGRNKKTNRTGRTEPNRTVLFGTGTNRAFSRSELNRTD